MNFVIHPEFWARWLGIIFIDLSLAGDNALVIAMAVLTLPPRQRLFGMIGGTVGAVVLRIALIAVVTQILLIPYLQAIGGLILMWIAIKLVRQDTTEGKEQKTREVTTLWEAMGIIIVADLIMSLDNVMAVAATAHGDLTLVLFGIGLSIPIVICGSSFLARLMERFRWIVWVGGGVLGWVAGELVISDAIVHDWIGSWKILLEWALPSLLAIALTILGWALAFQANPAIAEEQPLAGNDQ
jgi:YjbE family integral membrane protein